MKHGYLIDMDGNEAHTWKLPLPPGDYGYLLPPKRLIPPALDSLGRILRHLAHLMPSGNPLPLWPSLAWIYDQV